MPRRPRQKRPSKAVLRDQLTQFHETRDPKLRDALILAYSDLAAYLARKFGNRGEPVEDLIQVASIGLLKAIDRFDPARGTELPPTPPPRSSVRSSGTSATSSGPSASRAVCGSSTTR